MKLYLDPSGVRRLVQLAGDTVGGEYRRYYCTNIGDRKRGLLVWRPQGQILQDRVVDAQVGHERAWAGFTFDDDVGEEHVKITVYHILPVGTRPDSKLSHILNDPRTPERPGA